MYVPYTVHMKQFPDSMFLVNFEAFRTFPALARMMRISDFLQLSNQLEKMEIGSLEGKLSLIGRWIVHMEIQQVFMIKLKRIMN